MSHAVEERHPAGDALAAGAEDAGVSEAAARVRDHDAHPAGVRRAAARGGRLALPGAAPDGAARLAALGVGDDRQEPRRALLLAHGEGAQAAGAGGRELEPADGGGWTRAAVRVKRG